MDDIEELRRKRAIKVIITDIFMAISVIAIVFVLIAVVAGWRINSDLTFEQNGLVSIKTKPVGATVIIDGKKETTNTDMSKMLPGGKHVIELEKDGYERWEKEVEITPGWLLRLEYPKLFKQNREKNTIKEFEQIRFFHVSDDRTAAILATDDSTEWYYVTDFNNNPKFKKIDIRGVFSDTENGDFPHEIKSIEWSKNSEKVLIKTSGEKTEWGIINLKSVKDSINLTNDYARYEANSNAILAAARNTDTKVITSAKFENEVGDKIIAIVNNNLIRIDTSSKVISTPLAEHVTKFELLDSVVIFSTTFEEGKSYIKLLHLGEKTPTIVAINEDESAKISFNLTRFNSTSYVLYTIDNHLFVYSAKEFPNGAKLNMKNILDEEIGIIASEARLSFNNEFITLREGSRVVVFDAELEDWHEYDYGDEQVRFLDNYMYYRVDEASGKFLVWDFDSTNVRTLVVDTAINDYDALISTNDRNFYYISKTKEGLALIQEKLN